jgi:ribonuclease HI
VRYFTKNRIAVQPDKSQLLVVGASGDHVSVVVDGFEVTARDTIKVLGAKLDSKLTWEPHAKMVAGHASAIARSVRRSLRGLKPDEVAGMMQMLVHPVLDYGVIPLADPTAKAIGVLRRAYNRSARSAAGVKWGRGLGRTQPALRLLRWPVWEDRCRALRECFAMKVWEDGSPSSLRVLLPPADDPSAVFLCSRLRERREVRPRPILRAVGRKAFSHWGAVAVSSVIESEPEVSNPSSDDDMKPRPRHKFAGDSPEIAMFYGMLRDRFKDLKESAGLLSRTVVWTDGSAPRVSAVHHAVWAGAGVFYGPANRRNVAIPVRGRRTNQRAELEAFLYAITTDERPLEVRTDSRYVQQGVSRCRGRFRRRAWYAKPSLATHIKNADLWHRVDNVLERGRDVEVTWVKGHSSLADVQSGKADALDVWGNAGADFLAKYATSHCDHSAVARPHDWDG